MKRSVERVKGVNKATIDLNTGRMFVWFKTGKTVESAQLRRAVLESGFTPTRIIARENQSKNPKP